MGKNPVGSEALATPTNLSTLLSLSSALKDDTEASNEALRCIANALLLVPDARNIFVQKDVGGGEASVELLEVNSIPFESLPSRNLHPHQLDCRNPTYPRAYFLHLGYSFFVQSPSLIPRATSKHL